MNVSGPQRERVPFFASDPNPQMVSIERSGPGDPSPGLYLAERIGGSPQALDHDGRDRQAALRRLAPQFRQ